ncbi:PREDICTED: dynactin subunit 1 isoform X2 [Wasmannia auropunctata]|uniref:dynactin subunit 1 isoform X2 n=1 Tax=Wasmannia auropunctata TaxID=64793 RepID=UPI0005EF985C|nr:PREDICTED: dynactin subunit 1 isoform X2 [Wasmannia auropunctata]
MSYKIGQRVEVPVKECQGVIAYVGHPAFASGKWIGVILDEPKGKNNGSVKGQVYFKCAENHGMFARQTQLILLDEAGNRTEPVSPSSAGSNATTPDDSAARARSRLNSISMRRRNEPTASRLSLSGSRTLLSAPSTESLTGSSHDRRDGGESLIPAPTSTSKRASFVEKSPSTSSPPGKKPKAQDDQNNTGFVETLKPQFVPGQVMAGSAAAANLVEEKLSHLQLVQENDNLKSQVRDLTEKVETLRVKRMQDKERMKDFEKTKLQVEQLLEFKAKVMESQASLQRELQRARQEAREAHAAREQYQEEMSDLAETVEMATLDKEMAEEKAETLQIELEQLKEKLEEQTLDLEILRTEMSERAAGGGTTTANASSYEVKQLEQQNNRLRETLVKMRDLSAHEKHEFQKLQKDMDQKKSEILELGRTKEKLSSRVEEMEHQIADLQEQVDAALGAEEMVEMLGEKKMALEEKVAELEEAVADLEALQDMSDQLAESSKELELELREELDLALGAARDAQRHRDAALETLADRELTITKFRELTHQLQEQCLQLQQRVQSTESIKTNVRGADQLAEILDFQKTFAETRAQTKAVDLELRRLDAEEARNHVCYLLSFMPPAFLTRGGDHDAILTLLLIPRMTQKTEILISQVREKYRSIEKIDRPSVVRGHSVAQYSFRSRLCSHMYALQTTLGCFESALNSCTSEMLLKAGAAYPEMAAQEKSLDSLIELAKRDQLDENLPMDAIEKCCGYFATMFSVLFGESTAVNQARLIVNGTRTLGNTCDAIATDAAAIKVLIQGEGADIGKLCQHVETTCEVIQQHLKSARRRVPRDHAGPAFTVGANLGLDKDCNEQFSTCYQHGVKIMKTLQYLLKSALQAITENGDLDAGLAADKLKEMAATSSERVYDTEDLGPVATIKASLTVIQQLAANLAQKMAECENELAISGQTQSQQQTRESERITPIVARSNSVRKEVEETKILSRKLEARDSDIREARLALREKQEELSEMTLRKELAEKRYATQQHEHEMNVEKLKRKLEEAQNQLKRKEKEFEETMDHLQTDIDSLETEKGQLKEKLKSIGKKTISASGADSMTGSTSITSTLDNKYYVQEINALKQALNNEHQQKKKVMCAVLRQKLDSLEPLPSPTNLKSLDTKIQELRKKTTDLVKDVEKTLVYPTVPDLRRKVPETSYHYLLERQRNIMQLKERVDELVAQVRREAIKRTPGGRAEANFAVYPNREMAAAMQERKLLAAEIKIPYKGPEQSFSVNVGPQELRKIHTLLYY